jgi:hypothetical protein
MMPMAYVSLAVFVAALTFLAFALKWPERSVRISVTMTGARWYAPRLAAKLEDKVRKLINGFLVLKDGKNLALFTAYSVIYWVANGLGMWVLARGMGLELPLVGAFATMGVIAVGITLPNSPGLVGQFHYLTALGMSLYVPWMAASATPIAEKRPDLLAYAILLHGIQVVWYVGMGALSMLTSHVSFADMKKGWSEEEPAPPPEKQEAA